MVPINGVTSQAQGDPAREISRLRIDPGIRLDQHRLLIEAADADADDRPGVAMVVVAELRELLAGYEEGRLPVRHPLLGSGKSEGGLAHAGEGIDHRATNSVRICGYSRCSAASTRCSRLWGVSPTSIGTSALPSTSPASSSSVTRWTEQPLTLSPAAMARA